MTVTEQHVPMARLMKEQPKEVLLAKDGPGKLYYRLGPALRARGPAMKAEEQGFTVSRTLRAAGPGRRQADPESVRACRTVRGRSRPARWSASTSRSSPRTAPTSWSSTTRCRPASRARTQASRRRLQDVAGGVTNTSRRLRRRRLPWRRSSAAGGGGARGGASATPSCVTTACCCSPTTCPAGVYTYSYTARATTIGEFQLPPIHAEAMYAARSSSATARAARWVRCMV
jgi:hypothetical protein